MDRSTHAARVQRDQRTHVARMHADDMLAGDVLMSPRRCHAPGPDSSIPRDRGESLQPLLSDVRSAIYFGLTTRLIEG